MDMQLNIVFVRQVGLELPYKRIIKSSLVPRLEPDGATNVSKQDDRNINRSGFVQQPLPWHKQPCIVILREAQRQLIVERQENFYFLHILPLLHHARLPAGRANLTMICIEWG